MENDSLEKTMRTLGSVWLLFLKTALENSFFVFSEKKNCVWELNSRKQFLFSKTKNKNIFY